jgi:alkanesulfonate monooxygenase SsuD/methylene tetrahydromethanopterin reductase-like flavin-dependent oxidoreductase (luciferase family)
VAASARRAATLADGFYGATNYRDDLLLRQAEAFRSHREDGAIPTTRHSIEHEGAGTPQQLAAGHRMPATDYYTARDAWMGADGPGGPEMALVGTPEQVHAAIGRYVRAGVTSVQLRVAPAGTPPDVAQHTLDLVGAQVLPHWHDTTTHLEGDDDR